MIEVKDLNFFAGKKKILSEVSFSLSEGGFNAIIGNNGSGKTTLLKCLTRNNKVNNGIIRLDNWDLNSSYCFLPYPN